MFVTGKRNNFISLQIFENLFTSDSQNAYDQSRCQGCWFKSIKTNHTQQDSPHGRLLTCGYNSSVDDVVGS